jgi:hypothetical protein
VTSEEIVGSGKCEVGSEEIVVSRQQENNQEKLLTLRHFDKLSAAQAQCATAHCSLLTENGNTGNTGNNQSQTIDLQNLEPVTNTGNNTGNNTVIQ